METEEFWGIQLLPSCYRQGFLGRFYLRDLSQAVVVPVKLHVAVQRIRKRKKPKKLVAPNTSRVGRRGNVGKIHGEKHPNISHGKSMGIDHEPWTMAIFSLWKPYVPLSLFSWMKMCKMCKSFLSSGRRLMPSIQECLNKFWSDEARDLTVRPTLKWDIKWLNIGHMVHVVLLFLFWFCLVFLYFWYFGRWFFRSCSGEFGRFATLASGISIHVRGDKVNSGRPVRLGPGWVGWILTTVISISHMNIYEYIYIYI